MKTTVMVDKVGRMVLPKPVREAIGISGPMSVNIEVVSGTAQISTLERRSGTVARRRGRTVYTDRSRLIGTVAKQCPGCASGESENEAVP